MTYYVNGVDEIVSRALHEDIGTGDITTLITVPADLPSRGAFVASEGGIVAGLPVVAEVYRQLDSSLELTFMVADGDPVSAGAKLCEVRGSGQSILIGERVALNFLQRLSGIATRTARFVRLVAGSKARIVDTRKTTPGLRALEKYAVRVGGGLNHRLGLYDAVLIKDNHIAACGSLTAAVEAAFAQAPHTMTVTVECDTLDQVDEAVAAGADIVLLDNMTPDLLAQAVSRVGGQAATEASGGITEENVAAVAHAGVDIISVGALTHSVTALDISLELFAM